MPYTIKKPRILLQVLLILVSPIAQTAGSVPTNRGVIPARGINVLLVKIKHKVFVTFFFIVQTSIHVNMQQRGGSSRPESPTGTESGQVFLDIALKP